MAKTVSPGVVSVPGAGDFVADAMPDPFDERDLEYRPRLQSLPPVLDRRAEQIVLTQRGNSCTGHAMASLINTVLARQLLDTGLPFAPTSDSGPRSTNLRSQKNRPAKLALPKVSPYMLYRLARRYDEFEGEADAGSSLRGVFKGWFHHGVALSKEWPDLVMENEPDLDDPEFIDKCRDRPLGAFYRVNPYRLDDMQSALSELNAIVVSAVIHDGWVQPVEMSRNGQNLRVIARQVNAQTLGGHAFALVGYNEVGFLVQNSWGEAWGKGGFATLPYEDWLDCAYDAWVARAGVPKTPFVAGRNRATPATGGTLATAPGPDLQRLAMHVINLGNEGRLSTTGKFASTPHQIERAFEHMGRWHDCWSQDQPQSKREVVLYAHGGLNSEADGLATAQKHLNWWLNNRIYPLYFAWQSGPVETLVDQLGDLTQGRLPFGGLGFDLTEQFDRLVEKIARSSVRWMWDEMKENARAASEAINDAALIQWPPVSSATQEAMLAMPGASLTVTRLQRYLQDVGAENVRVHLVGHSAGAIFLAALLSRLADAGIAVESLALLAPAMRVDQWTEEMLPLLRVGRVRRFSTFAMTDQRELDDTVGTERITPYHKSLLYLVSRALERPEVGQQGEVPLLGMARFFDLPLEGSDSTLRQTIAGLPDAVMVFSRADTPDDARSDAASHGDFDDDTPTMTSVVMRALDVGDTALVQGYQPHAALHPFVCAPPLVDDMPSGLSSAAPLAALAAPPSQTAVEEGGASSSPGTQPKETAQPLEVAAATHPPGEEPVAETAEPQTGRPVAPQPDDNRPAVEVAIAPRSGSAIVDVLQYAGWKIEPGH